MTSTNIQQNRTTVARIIPVIMGFAAISCVAGDRTNLQRASASTSLPAPNHGHMADQGCPGHRPVQLLSLKDADGVPFQLAYVHGCGWKYVATEPSVDRRTSGSHATPVSAVTPANISMPEGEPLTVFIDGLTGYTFIWIRDGGWKFVGELATATP